MVKRWCSSHRLLYPDVPLPLSVTTLLYSTTNCQALRGSKLRSNRAHAAIFFARTFVDASASGVAWRMGQTVNARDRIRRSYCCPTAAKSLVFALRVLGFLQDLQEKQRADERTRTAYPCSLGVITQVLQGYAGDCKSRISKRHSLLRVAACCTVLRSQWYQSGINRGVVPSRSCSLAHASEVRSAPSRARQHTGNPRPIPSLNTQHGPSYRRRDAEALGSVTYSCSSLPSVIPRVSATKRRWSSADYSAE
jgi:hypothetical protein